MTDNTFLKLNAELSAKASELADAVMMDSKQYHSVMTFISTDLHKQLLLRVFYAVMTTASAIEHKERPGFTYTIEQMLAACIMVIADAKEKSADIQRNGGNPAHG
jgi:hypothetical protein